MAAKLTDLDPGTMTHDAPGTARHDASWLEPGDFAVVVNANARGYQRAKRAGMFAGLRADDLYESTSLADSERLVASLVEQGYRAIFAAGGDGTIAQLLNDLRAAVPNAAEQPRVGLLRMGTGNALASFVGTDRVEADLARLARGTRTEAVGVQLLECEGTLTPFTGCGADAGVLNDYIELKQRVSGTALERAMTGVRGYLLSGVLKTAPQLLAASQKRRVFVINEAPVAYAVNSRGDILQTFRRGDVLYSGPAMMVAAGAIPYYGYEMKMFPAAGRLPGLFQVRVAQMNPMMVVARLGKLWKGTMDREHGVHDFLTSRVRMEFDGEVPFHLSGDAAGYRREVSLKTSSRRFEFARLVDGSANVVQGPWGPHPYSR